MIEGGELLLLSRLYYTEEIGGDEPGGLRCGREEVMQDEALGKVFHTDVLRPTR